jgi:hypothetical protein
MFSSLKQQRGCASVSKFTTQGLEQLTVSFEEIAGLPDSVIDEMLEAGGEIVKREQAAHARKMLRGPYYADGVASGVKLGKTKRTSDGKALFVTFSGTQHGRPLSEIAFVNEFGKRNQPARPFIRTANEKCDGESLEAQRKVYDRWLKSKSL